MQLDDHGRVWVSFFCSSRVAELTIRHHHLFAKTDYRETAAKFQKEWRVREPHRQFDFAPHVQNHALVSIVNRGLVYCALEREFAESQVSLEFIF